MRFIKEARYFDNASEKSLWKSYRSARRQ